MVSPEDGQRIFLASRAGELSLMLRGEFDTGTESTPQTFTTKALLHDTSAKEEDRVEGIAKSRREDGSVEEWSVIEGRVMRWEKE